MKHGSLFTGIGGFDLAAEWMGWENVFHCENNTYAQKLLKQNFPGVESLGDIKETNFTRYANRIDVLSGGFPCQPYSVSGKQKGTNDMRHLWPEMLRAIGEIKAPWVVGENVRGLISWSNGLVFEQIQIDLESKGYEIFPCLLPSAGIGAQHKRERIFFIAYSSSFRLESKSKIHENYNKLFKKRSSGKIINDVDLSRYDLHRSDEHIRRDNGVPNWMDRIKGCGNAVVPQVILQIFKAIQQYENLNASIS